MQKTLKYAKDRTANAKASFEITPPSISSMIPAITLSSKRIINEKIKSNTTASTFSNRQYNHVLIIDDAV
jgi:hypothetical protein